MDFNFSDPSVLMFLLFVGRRIRSRCMHYSQHIDVGLRRNCVDDHDRQSDNRELSRTLFPPDPPQHRKAPEHLDRLQDAADHPFRRVLPITRDPGADRHQVIERLRREVNVHRPSRATPARAGSALHDHDFQPGRASPSSGRMRHGPLQSARPGGLPALAVSSPWQAHISYRRLT